MIIFFLLSIILFLQDSLRLEIKPHERYSPLLSLNLKTTPTSSELYFEASWIKPMYLNGSCPFWYWSEDDQNGKSNNFTKASERNLESNVTSLKERDELHSTIVSPAPHLSSMIGLSSFSNVDLNRLCRKYKIFETKVENNYLVSRIYKDVLRFFSHYGGSFDTTIKKGRIIDKIFEERFKNGSHWQGLNEYVMEHTLSNGDQGFKIWTSGQVEPSVLYGTNPNFVVALSKFDNLKTSPRYQDNNEAQTPNITTVIQDIGYIKMELNETQPGEVHVQLQIENPRQTIVDSTIFSSVIYEDAMYFIKESFPSFAKGKMLLRSNSRLHGILTSSIANAFKSVTMYKGYYHHLLWD